MHSPKDLQAINALAEASASQTLFIRSIDQMRVITFRRNAQARGLTFAQYLERLVDLHETAKRASFLPEVSDLLEEVQLQEVTA